MSSANATGKKQPNTPATQTLTLILSPFPEHPRHSAAVWNVFFSWARLAKGWSTKHLATRFFLEEDVDESGWVMICWHSTTCPSKVGIQVSVNAKLLGTRVHLPIWDGYGQQKLHPYKLVSQFHRAFKLQIAWEGNGLLRCKKTLESGLILLEPSSWIMKIRQGHFSPCGKEAPLAALTKIPTVNSGRSRSLPSWQFDH